MAIKKVYELSVDLKKTTTRVNIPVLVQGDSAEFRIRLLDNGAELSTVQLTGITKVSMQSGYDAQTVIQTVGTLQGSVAVFRLKKNELFRAGTVQAMVQLEDSADRISTLRFQYQVIADLTGNYIPGEQDITVFQRYMNDAQAKIDEINAAAEIMAATDVAQLTAKLADMGVDVKTLGAKGDGITDDTSAIQKALNEYSRIFISDGTYIINSSDNTSGLNVPSNREISFAPNAILKASGENTTQYRLMSIFGVENVTVNSPRLLGDREYNNSVDGEHGYGIYILNVKDVEINKPKTNNFWGDGLFIGGENTNGVVINHAVSSNNRRQGLSIVSGKNITINNSLFSKTNGTAPQAGVDIEPNDHITPLDNLVFNNCVFEESASAGLLLYYIGQRFTATFNDCKIIGTHLGIKESSMNNGKGSLTFNNLTIIDSPINAIRLEGTTIPIKINGLTIINPNRNGSTGNLGDAIFIDAVKGSNKNIEIHDVKVYNDNGKGNPLSVWTTSAIEGAVTENIKIDFTEVYTDKVVAIPNKLALKNIQVTYPYEKRLKRHIGNLTDLQMRDNRWFYSIFTNETIAYSVEHTIGYNSVFEGHEIGLKVMSPHDLSFLFANGTLADGSKRIVSKEVGAELIIRYEHGKWFIKKQIGTWTKTL